jgi:hypothetical protein
MTRTTIGLNRGRKTWMILRGIVWLVAGNLFAAMLVRLQGGISMDLLGMYLVVAVLGLVPIYRATRSQIEFSGDEITYTEPLFKIICNWDDFIGLRISSDGVALHFLDSRIKTFEFIARSLKYLGLWNNTIPLSPYLTLSNRMRVWEEIECHLEKGQEKKILELLLTGSL